MMNKVVYIANTPYVTVLNSKLYVASTYNNLVCDELVDLERVASMNYHDLCTN